jgi:hypothetical protein
MKLPRLPNRHDSGKLGKLNSVCAQTGLTSGTGLHDGRRRGVIFPEGVIGDTLFGATVASLKFFRQGLNDANSVAFSASLANGRSVAVRADLAPSPGGGPLLGSSFAGPPAGPDALPRGLPGDSPAHPGRPTPVDAGSAGGPPAGAPGAGAGAGAPAAMPAQSPGARHGLAKVGAAEQGSWLVAMDAPGWAKRFWAGVGW